MKEVTVGVEELRAMEWTRAAIRWPRPAPARASTSMPIIVTNRSFAAGTSGFESGISENKVRSHGDQLHAVICLNQDADRTPRRRKSVPEEWSYSTQTSFIAMSLCFRGDKVAAVPLPIGALTTEHGETPAGHAKTRWRRSALLFLLDLDASVWRRSPRGNVSPQRTRSGRY